VSDLTSNLYLAIHARDLTGPGLLGASARLRTFGAIGAVALGGVVVASLKAASNFQSMTQSIANNTTMGQGGLDQMRASILRLGNDSNAPLDQLGQGYMRATNLGYGAADATQILTAAMKSAASTNSNTADTTNTLASVMHEFNLQGSAAAKTMDILHLASAQGNTTLEQFTTGGNKAIAMAANLGVPLNQVTAALSAMTRHGSIENASTTIVGALSKIVNPAKAAQKELASLTLKTGIDLLGDFTPAGLKAKGLTGILADLKAATNGNAQEIFKLIPALRGGQAAMILTGNGAKDYSGILASLNGVTAKSGITARAYAATQKTASFQFGELRNKVQILAIALGTQLLPYATAAASWLGARLPGAVAALTPRLTTLITGAVGVGRAFLAAVEAMGRVASGLKGLVAPLLMTATHLRATRQGTAQLGAGLALLIPAVVAIKAGMVAWTLATTAWTLATKASTLAQNMFTLAQKAGKLVMVEARAVIAAYTAANKALGLAYVAVRLGIIQSTAAAVGNKIATAAQTIVTVAQKIAVAAVTIATKAWTLAIEGAKAATIALTLYGGRGVAAMVAQKIAAGAVMLATKGWTLAQWLLNTALIDNPIGIVVLAVAGLVAGIIWAYKNVKFFHNAVNAVWKFLSSVFAPGLGAVASGLKNVLGGALDWVTSKVKGLLGFFGNLLHMFSSLPGVKAVIGAAYTAAGVTPPAPHAQGHTGHGHHSPDPHHATHGAGGVRFVGPSRGMIAARFGAAYNHGPAGHGEMSHAAWQRAWNIEHPPGKPKKGIVGGHNYNIDLTAAMNKYGDDMKLYHAGLISQTKILSDIAAIGKTEHAGHLTDTTARLRNDVNTANKLTAHHAEVKAGAKAKTAQTKQFHQQTTDLGALYYRDNMTLQQDMRDRNFTAARQVIAAMTSIKQAIEVQHGISKSQAAQDARAFSNDQLSKVHKAASAPARADLSTLSGLVKHWRDMFMADKKAGNTGGEFADLAKFKTADLAYQKALRPKNGALAVTLANDDWIKLGGTLSNGLKKLTAPKIGTGFQRSVYGYTSRQQVGQGVGLGETLVTFGGRVGKDPAQQMIQKLETQVQQLTQQNAVLSSLLGAVEDGTAATMAVRDAIKSAGRAQPGSGGNPLRPYGLATAVR